jgi:hypothetical protein
VESKYMTKNGSMAGINQKIDLLASVALWKMRVSRRRQEETKTYKRH